MPASQEQKVDFLLKKIGYSASKTGVAEDESTIGLSTNTAKKPFEEGIASPLVIPSTTILSDSSFIPTTPPGSDTLYVKGYRTATALRMTRDSTVGTNTRSYIAYTTYNDTSSARLTNWIDTQFGSSYIIKVYKGDPNSSGVELQQAGGNAGTDGWFFDYSSGVLNFNGINLPDGVGATNIYIVGYRYIGATGVQPPAGIGTFHDLVVHNNFSVAGLSTFNDDVRFVGAAATILFDKSGSNLEFNDNAEATFGTDQDLRIFHAVGYNYFKAGASNTEIHIKDNTNGNVAKFKPGGNNELYFNTAKKFETTLTGAQVTGLTDTDTLLVSGISTFVGIITASAVGNVIPFLFNNYSDLPSASSYHGAFAHVHEYGKGYFAHAGNWYELVNKETTGIVGTGTERYDIGYLDATNLYVSGITTLGSIGISTGLISGPAITYIDPATVGDNTGLLVVKGNLQVDGTQTTVNSSTMTVTDKNIEIAKGAANDAAVDGAGITVESGEGNKTWNWVDATDSWTSSEHIRIPDDKVFGFATDTNTYIGRPAADTIAFTHGGDEKVTFTSDGKVGIGTANPDELLHLKSSATTVKAKIQSTATNSYPTLRFANDARTYDFAIDGATDSLRVYDVTATEERLTITSSGNVGINSTAPTALLDVNGTAKIGDYDQLEVLTGGQVQLKWKNSTVLSTFGPPTSSQGANFVGTLAFQGNGYKATFGNSGELEILNLSDISLVRDIRAGVGTLAIEADNLFLRNKGGSQNYFEGTDDAGVKLNFAGNEKLTTTNTGVSITGITTTTQLEIGTLGQSLVGITTILDEDDMASNSATALVTQQSLVAYVGNSAPGGSSLAVSADSGSNETINLSTEVLDIEGTANEIETATGTNKVVIGLPDNVSVTGDVGIGASLNVVGVSTFVGVVTTSNDLFVGQRLNVAGVSTFNGDLLIDSNSAEINLKAGTSGQTGAINWTFHTPSTPYSSISLPFDTRTTDGFIVDGDNYNVSVKTDGSVKLYSGGNIKLITNGNGIDVTGLTETDTLTTGNATFTGTVSAGSTTGTNGYYLKTTGIGVTWAAFPSSRTTSTQTATAGQTTFNFSYNVGFVDVFVNGVKLPTSEFTASNGSTIVLDDAAFENDTLEFISLNTLPVTSGGGASNLTGLADVTISGTPVTGETLQHNGSEFVNDYTVTATTTSTSQTPILNLGTATYRSVEYTIQITEGTKYHVTKVLAIHDGTNVTFNEYGTLFTTSSLSTFALDVSSGNMRLLATPASTNSTAFKVKFTGIKV